MTGHWPAKAETRRAAIYARFSSDRQSDRSNADQIALCRDWCARQGMVVVAVFEDAALSGASILGRPQMQQLIERARERMFDVVVADSLSRIGRDEEDRAAIRKRLAFHDIAMATPVDGIVTRLVDGIRAVMDGNYLEDLKHATRRGMAGVVREGRSAGGRAYGYRAVPGEAGRLAVVADEAEIVREIFARFAGGETPRAIAGDLNRRGVRPPRGAKWNASTIHGNKRRGNGILQNALYAGEMVWNKVRMIKDPDTGKRISRPNPPKEWQRRPAPELAILPPESFAAVLARGKAVASEAPQMRRMPRRMLSGLLRCGACGSGLSIYGQGKVGELRVRCSRHAESRTCPDPRSFRLDTIEATVTRALRRELRHPELLATYVREYHAERKRLAGQAGKRRGELERRCGEIDRALARATEALLNGLGDPAAIDTRCKELRAERDRLEIEMAALPDTTAVVALHPAALARYAEQVKRLEETIARSGAAGDRDAVEAIRDLIETVVVRPGRARATIEVEITGRLAYLCADAFPSGRHSGGSLVAGGRLTHPARTGNSHKFRLLEAG